MIGVTATRLGAPASGGRPLLVLGPSLGTSTATLWTRCAAHLEADVLGWDLPGHGPSEPATGPFTVGDLGTAVLHVVDRVLADRGDAGGSFHYAGDSIGGAVGLQLLLDHPGRITTATVLCTGARIGTPDSWRERAEFVRANGAAAMVEASTRRWFGPGFVEREPDAAAALLQALREVDAASYVYTCEALGAFDVRDRLGEIAAPVLAVAGSHDEAAPIAGLREIAHAVRNGRLTVLDRVAHLAPVEAPAEVAELITAHIARAAGYAVRRAALGDAHVDRAIAHTTEFTRDFQDLITRYAWGTVWTRPGLDRRSRSMITLTALVAGGHHEELALHIRAARANGLTVDEIKEVLLQTAIYCGVPAANTAFRIAQQVLDEDGSGDSG